MRKTRLVIVAFLLCPLLGRAQTWTNQGQMSSCSGAATGTYTPPRAYPCYRGQQPILYDPLDQKIILWFADAGSTEEEWGNSLFLYDPSQGVTSAAWTPIWYSLYEQTGGSAPISSISRTRGVTTFSVTNSNTYARSFVVGDTVEINGVSDPTFNGQFTIASVVSCASTFLCYTFTYNQPGQPDSTPSATGSRVVGPAEATTRPTPRHNQGLIYDTTGNALWQMMGVCDVDSNATTIMGSHGGCYDLYKMTKSGAQWSWTTVHGFGTSNFSTTETAMTCPSGSNSSDCGWKWHWVGYDPVNDILVMFGGTWNSSARSETYEYKPSTDTLTVVCGAQGTPSCNPVPSARTAYADSRMPAIGGGRLLLFGGISGSTQLGDTWIYDTNTHTWSQPASANSPNTAPPANYNAMYDWDSTIGRVVLIDNNQSGSHTWFFDPTALQWTDTGYSGGPILDVSNATLPAFTGAYDAFLNEFVVFSHVLNVNPSQTNIWTLSLPTSLGPAAAADLSPSSLTFSTQAGTTSSPQQITLTSSGLVALTIPSISINGTDASDFSETNNCPLSPATLGVGVSCSISVAFKPSLTTVETATLMIFDNADGSPQTIPLSGKDTSTQPDFSLAAANGANCPAGGNCSTSAMITAGQAATYNLQVSATAGFNGTIALSCSDAPPQATCSITPASVVFHDASTSAFTVTVSTTARSIVVPVTELLKNRPRTSAASKLTSWLTLALLVGLVAQKIRKQPILPVAGFAFLALVLLSGCGFTRGGTSGTSGTPPGTPTLTVRGTSGSTTHSLILTLTVT